MNKFYNLFLRFIGFILIVLLIAFYMSDSYSVQSIDNLAYVIALGIDVSETNNIKLTIQLAKPNSSSSESSSSSSQSSSSVINSVDCSSIESGINLINSYISKNVNLAHCKVVVISEALATKGIEEYIYNLANNLEVSSHAKLIISKCSATDFLASSNPVLENFSARYYEIAPSSSKSTGYTKAISLIQFFSDYLDDFKEPLAILGNVNNKSTHDTSSNTTNNVNSDNSRIAGDTPINSSNNIECMGIALFKDDKMIGELTGLESIYHMIVSGDLKYSNIQIPNPNDKNRNIDLNIKLSNKPKVDIDFINGFAYIKIKIKLNIRILSVDKDFDFTNNSEIDKFENDLNSFLEKEISKYLYKMAKEYNCDIDGFGKYATKYFPTIGEWRQYDWLNNFDNSFFNVTIDSKIRSGYTFISF